MRNVWADGEGIPCHGPVVYPIGICYPQDMTAILLKVSEELLARSTRAAESLRMSRAEYIREAVARMNRVVESARRARRLAEVSRRVRDESRRVNAEFDAFESTPEA